MKTFLKLKRIYFKLIIVFILLPSFGALVPDLISGLGGGLYAQEAELFRTWYLTKVTIGDIDYIPSDYGYYPSILFTEGGGIYYFHLPDPQNIECRASVYDFQIDPNSFVIDQEEWLCFPDNICLDDPITGPCSIIYGRHSDLFIQINTPFIYIIEQNSDGTFSLEITNSDGNQAFYSSEFLSLEVFNSIEISISPNPAKDLLYITQNDYQVLTAIIYDIQGRVMIDKTIETHNSTINVSMLQKGVYFIVFENEMGERVSKKFLKH